MNETRDLYFITNREDPRKLACNVPKETALKVIQEFLDYHEYKSYYTRAWDDESGRWFDVGSWTEFFLWGIPKEVECQNEESKDTEE